MSPPVALLAAAAAIRGVDFLSRQLWLPGCVWIAGAVLCLAHERWGPAGVLAASAWTLVGVHYYNHVVLVLWVSATLALFAGERPRAFVIRAQLSIVYLFAGLAKLTPDWLSGAVLQAQPGRLPEELLAVAAVGAVVAELFLAGALWLGRLRPAVLAVAIPLHLGFWLLMGVDVVWSPGLLPFNLLALGLLTWSTGRRLRPTGAGLDSASTAARPTGWTEPGTSA